MPKRFTTTTVSLLTAMAVCAWTNGFIAPAAAASIANNFIEFTAAVEDAPAPGGWSQFCGRYPTECQGSATDTRQIELTDEKWDALVGANNWVNRNIKPLTDKKHWGKINVWTYAEDGYGDCKDYVLLKRRILMEIGFPREALLVAIVWTQQNNGHAVLIARTNAGDFVLDNLSPKVLLWTKVGHDFVKRQSPTDPNKWVYIDGHQRHGPTLEGNYIAAATDSELAPVRHEN